MDTKPTFLAAWFGTAITALYFAVLLLVYISIDHVILPTNHNFKLYSALPENNVSISDSVVSRDARAKIVENFFKGYGSVLGAYADSFIQVADKYKLDYRLLPAISMQESNGAKKVIADSFNPFGYGIYGSQVKRFNSWEEAIDRVGRGLREDYINKGLTTPEQIMTKYTPPSIPLGGPWAKGVYTFMQELQ